MGGALMSKDIIQQQQLSVYLSALNLYHPRYNVDQWVGQHTIPPFQNPTDLFVNFIFSFITTYITQQSSLNLCHDILTDLFKYYSFILYIFIHRTTQLIVFVFVFFRNGVQQMLQTDRHGTKSTLDSPVLESHTISSGMSAKTENRSTSKNLISK